MNTLTQLSDQCVKCGLCHQVCPTYNLYQRESESPRGRIQLINAISKGELKLDANSSSALDHCLGCRACEQACPADVQYSKLIKGIRAEQKKPLKTRILLRLLNYPRLIKLALTSLQKLPLHKLAKFTLPYLRPIFTWQKLHMEHEQTAFNSVIVDSKATPAVSPAATFDTAGHAQTASPQAPVILFPGCIEPIMYPKLIDSASQLLSLLKVEHQLLTQGHCCGALTGYAGDAKRSKQQQQKLKVVCEDKTVLTLSSGCHAELRSYHNRLSSVSTYLNKLFAEATPFPIKPLAQKALLHVPCSAHYPDNTASADAALLSRIPNLQLIRYQESCCGAAGMHMLNHPAQAQALAAPIINNLKSEGITLLISSNIGCLMHIANCAEQAELPLKIKHPLEVFHEQVLGF